MSRHTDDKAVFVLPFTLLVRVQHKFPELRIKLLLAQVMAKLHATDLWAFQSLRVN